MRRVGHQRLLVALLYLTALVWPVLFGFPLIASNISGATYFGTVQVVNNSTVAANVTSNITNMSVTNFVDGGFVPSASNTTMAMRTTSGADVAFQPGHGTNTWMTWVPSIAEDGLLSYLFFTGTITGGKVRYFPGTGGMTTADAAGMELGANFTIQQSGWVDTSSGSNKNLVSKIEAFRIYVSSASSIRAAILDDATADEYLVPNSHSECNISDELGCAACNSHFQCVDDPYASPDDSTTRVYSTNTSYERDLYLLQDGSIGSDAVVNAVTVYYRIYCTGNDGKATPWIKLGASELSGTEATATASWVTQSQVFSRPGGGDWTPADIPDLIAGVGLKRVGGSPAECTQVYVKVNYTPYAEAVAVTATGIASGEHTVTITADSTDLAISVDGVEEDSTALAGASVADNTNTWTFLANDVMPYMEYQFLSVGGNARQYILWQYDTTFTDLSGSGHDATPTFAVDSSDSDIAASLLSYGPVAEAQAPAYSVSDAPDLITTAPNLTSEFSDTIAPTIPGADVITAAAASSSTPAQLPWVMITSFVIVVLSLTTTYVMREYGSTGSVFVKTAVIAVLMGAVIALRIFDFWQILFFLLPAIALGLASRPQETLG